VVEDLLAKGEDWQEWTVDGSGSIKGVKLASGEEAKEHDVQQIPFWFGEAKYVSHQVKLEGKTEVVPVSKVLQVQWEGQIVRVMYSTGSRVAEGEVEGVEEFEQDFSEA
jgi:hypothetical protein